MHFAASAVYFDLGPGGPRYKVVASTMGPLHASEYRNGIAQHLRWPDSGQAQLAEQEK